MPPNKPPKAPIKLKMMATTAAAVTAGRESRLASVFIVAMNHHPKRERNLSMVLVYIISRSVVTGNQREHEGQVAA
jgi:tryptophan synthase alpha subunit